MTTTLRHMAAGARFVLCRTGEKFELVRRERWRGKTRIVVRHEDNGREGWLHHQCYVKPIVRIANDGPL